MNILIVRLSSLGDVIHDLPVVADIQHCFPDAHIDWVVEEAYVSLLTYHPGIRTVLPIALRRWRKQGTFVQTMQEIRHFLGALRMVSYDFILDTQGLLKSSIVMRLARLNGHQGIRAGLANRTEASGYESLSRLFHHQSVFVAPRTHAVLRARHIAAQVLGYSLENLPINFGLNSIQGMPPPVIQGQQSALPYVLFFHGTSCVRKEWPVSHWVTLGQQLFNEGFLVLLPWGNKIEEQRAAYLANRIAHALVLPPLCLIDIFSLIQHVTCVIGVDTGLTHLAAACCCPTVELYCDTPRWKYEGFWTSRVMSLGDRGYPPTCDAVVAAVRKTRIATTYCV